MLNNEQLAQALANAPFDRVTEEYIKSRFVGEPVFTRFSGTVTICEITLDNGYSVRGESACVNPGNYDQQVGETYAYNDAFRKFWPLFGFLLSEQNYWSQKKAA